jgi:hypothetical protein
MGRAGSNLRPPSKTSADEPIVEGATANLFRQIPVSRAMELLTGRLMAVDSEHEQADPLTPWS